MKRRQKAPKAGLRELTVLTESLKAPKKLKANKKKKKGDVTYPIFKKASNVDHQNLILTKLGNLRSFLITFKTRRGYVLLVEILKDVLTFSSDTEQPPEEIIGDL